MPPLGGAERPVGEIHIRQNYVFPPYLSWFPDSSALVIVDSPAPQQTEGLFVISVETGEKRALTTPSPSAPADMTPAVSPDGRTVAFKRGPALYVLAVGRISHRRQSPGPLQARTPFCTSRRGLQTARRSSIGATRSLWRVDPSGGQPPARLPFGRPGRVHARDFPIRLRQAGTTGLCSKYRLTRMCGARFTGTGRAGDLCTCSRHRVDDVRHEPAVLSGRQTSRLPIKPIRFHEIWVADLDGANAVLLTAWGLLQEPAHPAGLPMDRRSRSIPVSRGNSRSTSSPPAAGSPDA